MFVSKPCFAQPACDANHAASRRCWRLQEGCLERALICDVTVAFFSLSELRYRKLFRALFWICDSKHQQQHFFNVDGFISISNQVFC